MKLIQQRFLLVHLLWMLLQPSLPDELQRQVRLFFLLVGRILLQARFLTLAVRLVTASTSIKLLIRCYYVTYVMRAIIEPALVRGGFLLRMNGGVAPSASARNQTPSSRSSRTFPRIRRSLNDPSSLRLVWFISTKSPNLARLKWPSRVSQAHGR